MKDSSRRIFLKIGLTGATGVAFAGMASQSFTLESSLLVEPKDITIIDFGAVGDGKKLNTLVIQKD